MIFIANTIFTNCNFHYIIVFWQIISFQSSDDWRISTWICIFQWFSFLSKRQRRLDNWFAFKKTNYWSRSFLFQTKFSRHEEFCCKLMQFILSSNYLIFIMSTAIIYPVIFFDVSDHNRLCFFLKIQITTPLSSHQLLKLDLSTCKKFHEKGNK